MSEKIVNGANIDDILSKLGSLDEVTLGIIKNKLAQVESQHQASESAPEPEPAAEPAPEPAPEPTPEPKEEQSSTEAADPDPVVQWVWIGMRQSGAIQMQLPEKIIPGAIWACLSFANKEWDFMYTRLREQELARQLAAQQGEKK